MKKLINILFMIQLVVFLAGCCPCGKKPQDQNQAPAEPQQAEQPPAN